MADKSACYLDQERDYQDRQYLCSQLQACREYLTDTVSEQSVGVVRECEKEYGLYCLLLKKLQAVMKQDLVEYEQQMERACQ